MPFIFDGWLVSPLSNFSGSKNKHSYIQSPKTSKHKGLAVLIPANKIPLGLCLGTGSCIRVLATIHNVTSKSVASELIHIYKAFDLLGNCIFHSCPQLLQEAKIYFPFLKQPRP